MARTRHRNNFGGGRSRSIMISYATKSFTPVAGSIFGPLSQTHISKSEFKNEISSSALLDIQMTLFCVCGVDSFIPELEHLIEKRFHGLFSKKNPLKSDSWIQIHETKLRSTSSAEENFADEIAWITWKTKQDLEIWPFLNSLLEMWVWESGPKIDPATGVRKHWERTSIGGVRACVSIIKLWVVLRSEQIELQAKLLNYFLGSNKSNINQRDSVAGSSTICDSEKVQPIANRVAQNLEIIPNNFQFSTRRTRILMGFIISYLVLIVNPMGRILVLWKSCRNNLEILCHLQSAVLEILDLSKFVVLTIFFQNVFSLLEPQSPCDLLNDRFVASLQWQSNLICQRYKGVEREPQPELRSRLELWSRSWHGWFLPQPELRSRLELWSRSWHGWFLEQSFLVRKLFYNETAAQVGVLAGRRKYVAVCCSVSQCIAVMRLESHGSLWFNPSQVYRFCQPPHPASPLPTL